VTRLKRAPWEEEVMTKRLSAIAPVVAAAIALTPAPAAAQKQGGTLRIYHRDNPPSASIHEEATFSVNEPFMAVYNNLVMFDPAKRHESVDTLVPDLAKSWEWNADKTKLTFKLNEGVKWHDGKPFTAKDVQCTFHLVAGKTESEDFRKNPRKVWYFNLNEVTTNGDYEVTFNLKAPQPSFVMLLASGYTPVYPCHVAQRDMRTKPVGTGPFKFAEFKRNESIKLVKNPDYFKKGRPYLDAIEMKIIENRSTRILAFVAGEFDMTFINDITIPLLKDVKSQSPNAVCDVATTNVNTNLIVNQTSPPFNNPLIRKAMALTLDRKAFSQILSEGQAILGGAMLPAPTGEWGMPPEVLEKLPGYGTDVEKNRAEARKIMEGLGYGPGKTLKVKVATRNLAIYRDPAVILIDQLKQIHIDGELDNVDSPQWFAKVARKDYQVGLNLTGSGVDDPDVNLVENFTCKSERNYTEYCNADVDKAIFAQSSEIDPKKRKQLVFEIEKKLAEDVARPIIFHDIQATCWHPNVKGYISHDNSSYNNLRFENVWLDK
jgi:peptide/nickel transport system substrate-binding protein